MSEEKKDATKEQPVKKTAAEIDLEIKQLELDNKRLEIEEKKANLQDLQERLQERQLKREAISQRSKINAATLEQTALNQFRREKACTHKKGGNGLPDFVGGRGQDPQYAVIKHIMLNGDTWVRCLRCGKTWKPPLEEDFKTRAEFEKAHEDYLEAVNFQTKNATSSSYMFRYSDGGAYSRRVLRATTLR